MFMKILIADPHPEVQTALCLAAGRIPEVREASTASSLVQLLGLCAATCPDLVLFDLDLAHPTRSHPQPLADLVAVLRRLCPHARLVGMSTRFDAQQQALSAGIDGYISKTDPPDAFLASIQKFLAS
jgi:DNA-binding NarL/FixJ family response regulator